MMDCPVLDHRRDGLLFLPGSPTRILWAQRLQAYREVGGGLVARQNHFLGHANPFGGGENVMQRRAQILAAAVSLVVLALAGAARGAVEQKVTIAMGEEGGRMYYRPDRVTLSAGVKAEILLVNRGAKTHEWMVYPTLTAPGKPEHEWTEENSYFKGVEVKAEGEGIEVVSKDLLEIELKPGKRVEVSFTPVKKGTFQMGCLLPGHWEAGMKGTLVVK